MRNEIVALVDNNKVITFENLLGELKKTFPELTQGTLAKNIRSLSAENEIISSSKYIYSPKHLESKEMFVHWNVNQLCWVEESDKTNNYGISFNGGENLLLVANKKDALYGSHVSGYLLVDPETQKTTFFVNETLKMKPVSLFVINNSKESVWTILNSNVGMNISTQAFSNANYEDGDIVKLDSLNFKINEKFGNIKDKDVEGKMIQLLADIKEAPQDTDLTALNNVLSFDNSPFYTIDSAYTKDIDDAIYCVKNDDGSFTLKVAIADVSSFVLPGSELDKHAEKTTTSFYFYNHVVHMLSRQLAEKHCSLNVGENRNAMIVTMNINKEGITEKVDFSNKKICSNARLTYDDVNKFLQGSSMEESFQMSEGIVKTYVKDERIEKSLLDLKELSEKLHVKYNPTYWFVQSPELEIGENGKVKSLYIEQRDRSDSNTMVEVAMLAANKAAAKFLHENNINASALFRNQTAPETELDRPKPAQYASNNEGHWGLKADYYTHFTSPIRRYCDLVVHRMIKSVLNKENTNDLTHQLNDVAVKINEQQYKDKVCGNRERNLLSSQYLETLVNEKDLHHKYQIVDYTENGVVFRNSQLIDMYLPIFKLDRVMQDEIKSNILKNNNPLPEEKSKFINELNEKYIFKCFLDNYNWIKDFKDITFKHYLRDENKDKIVETTDIEKPKAKI